MNKATLRQVGVYAGFLIVPLLLVGVILLLTYRSFSLGLIIDLVVLAVAVVIFGATNPVLVRDALGRRAVSVWINTVLLVVGFAGIMVLLNILTTRVTVRADTTQTGQFSVSDATIKVIQKLPAPVTVSVIYSQQTSSQLQQATDLLNEYKQRSDKITVETVNSDVNPPKAAQLGAKSDPDVIFQMGQKRQETSSLDEQSFTRALLALESNQQYRVFFVQGQGEPSLSSGTTSTGQAVSFSAAATALRNNNYLVDTLNLTTNATSNTDVKGTVTLSPTTDILMIAAPNQPFTAQDKTKITQFLQQGGRAMVLNDVTPQFSSQAAQKPQANVNDILSNFGVKFDTGIAAELDPQHVIPLSPYLPVPTLVGTQSDITRNLTVYNVVMPFSSAIEQISTSPISSTATYTPLYQTTAQSFLQTDPNAQQFDPTKDKRGPLVLGASLEVPTKPITGTTTQAATRLVLFGSYLWAVDNQSVGNSQQSIGVGLTQQPGTYALFLNSVNWLAAQPDAVVIPAKATNNHPFTITQSQDTFVFYSAFLGLPILILFMGLLVWWRRR